MILIFLWQLSLKGLPNNRVKFAPFGRGGGQKAAATYPIRYTAYGMTTLTKANADDLQQKAKATR